jgi:hypothetical protein
MKPSVLSQEELDAIAAQCRADLAIPRWVKIGLAALVIAETVVGLAVLL